MTVVKTRADLPELRVKIKSLAAEAVIIRREERKSLGNARWLKNSQQDASGFYSQYDRLHSHRVYDVRDEARGAQLAYAYLRGVPKAKVEANTKWEDVPARVVGIAFRLVGKYGSWSSSLKPSEFTRDFSGWYSAR
jgi:hypothetical protein